MNKNNPINFTPAQLLEICHGQWLIPPQTTTTIHKIEDDTRKITQGDLFIAIPGEFCDGHNYLNNAIVNGAKIICVHKNIDNKIKKLCNKNQVACLLVKNTLTTFHAIANAHRQKFPNLKVVAITGSSGKTSTKEIIASICQQQYPNQILKTDGNTNNHFGVPRNLLRITNQHKIAIIELGSNHHGEIAQLAQIVQPNITCVNNIGSAHLQFFKNLQGVSEEKFSIMTALTKNGIAIIPQQNLYPEIAKKYLQNHTCLTFGNTETANISVQYNGYQNQQYNITIELPSKNNYNINWDWKGKHQAMNAAAAIAIAVALNINEKYICNGLQQAKPPKMRMELQKQNQINWINDAYNANPDSMNAGIEWFTQYCKTNKIKQAFIILGDMLELGTDAPKMHEQIIANLITKHNNNKIICIGNIMSKIGKKYNLKNFPTSEQAKQFITETIPPDSWVYLKASRSIALDTIIQNP